LPCPRYRQVKLNWELQPGNLVLHWRESGGPHPQQPAMPGFGTRIITASIERQLGARPGLIGMPRAAMHSDRAA